jgi:serine/threonine protein kinase
MDTGDVDVTAITASANGATVPRPCRSAGEGEDDESRLLSLLERWHERYLRNEDPTPEELGAEDPVLRELLREEIRCHKRLFDALGLPQAPSLAETADVWTGAGQADARVASPNLAGPVSRIGRYQVLGSLGRGGQGDVFQVLHPELSKVFVLKLARRFAGADRAALDRMLREGRLLAGCDHPNLVRVIDLDFHEGRPFVVMEHVHGLNLERFAAQHQPTLQEVARLVADLCRAVSYVHRRGVLHLDIKPRNVLIDESGRPRLIDFGLAQLRHAWSEDAAGSTGGTTSYMSPEQARGDEERIGPWTDVFGLGGVLFYLLTGRPVYQGTSGLAALQQASQGEQVTPRKVNPRAPRRLERICLKALAPDPERRYRTAEDLERALRRFLWTPAVAAIGLIVLVLVSAAWLASRPRSLLSETQARSLPVASAKGGDLREVPLPRVTAFELDHFRQDPKLKSLGTIGKSPDDARCDDAVRILVRFDSPVYCYLVALNPDGKDQLCHPKQPTEEPARVVEVGFPSRAEDYFRLGEEPGLQAFVVVASRKPLPAYAQWSDRIRWPWKRVTADGVWRFDGRWIHLVSNKDRGVVASISDSPRPFRDICEYLSKLHGIEVSQAIAFPVRPKD